MERTGDDSNSNDSDISEEDAPSRIYLATPTPPHVAEFQELRESLPPPVPLISQDLRYQDDSNITMKICLKLTADVSLSKETSQAPSPVKELTKNEESLSFDPLVNLEDVIVKLVGNERVDIDKFPEIVYARNYTCINKESSSHSRKGNTRELSGISGASFGSPQSILSLDPHSFMRKKSKDALVFESRFESGNLNYAVQMNENEYSLILQYDTNCVGHTQWYYFRVSNTKRGQTVRFNIINMSKGDSLYKRGMKVMIFSEKEEQMYGFRWRRGGEKIDYFCNDYEILQDGEYQKLHTLSFTYSFQHDRDVVYFAYSEPYTYSNLREDLGRLDWKQPWMRRGVLCQTLGGVPCEYLIIKNPGEGDRRKPAVLLTARVHPGETVGSLVMKGALEYLISSDPDAASLRETFVFIIIPMLNPDGVIIGNNRYGFDGTDLNRRFSAPHKVQQSTIYYLKKMIYAIAKEYTLP